MSARKRRKICPTRERRETDDYLKIGSYGGGSDHFTSTVPGSMVSTGGSTTRDVSTRQSRTWPGAPPDTYMSIGAGGNCAAMFPSLNMVLVCAEGQWGKLEAGKAESRMNRILARGRAGGGRRSKGPRISDSSRRYLGRPHQVASRRRWISADLPPMHPIQIPIRFLTTGSRCGSPAQRETATTSPVSLRAMDRAGCPAMFGAYLLTGRSGHMAVSGFVSRG